MSLFGLDLSQGFKVIFSFKLKNICLCNKSESDLILLGLADRIAPPPGYICHRCKVPGHFIHHCPTNGDPAFDGSYALPGGGVGVLKPNEAAFQKEIQGIPSSHSVVVLPAELYCPLCNLVMKHAVLASKCCFKSFCDKCIREYIISKSLCTCGATNVLSDHLIPNNTLRNTIVRMLESSNSTGARGSSAFQAQDMESAPCPQAKIPCSKGASPTLSEPSKGVVLAPKSEVNLEAEEMTEAVEADNVARRMIAGQGVEVSEAGHECAREPGSQMYPLVTDEEMQQKPISGNIEKKEKKLADMQPRPHQDFADVPRNFASSKRKVKHNDEDYKQHHHQPLKKERLHHHRSELVLATRLPILPVDRIYESSDGERHFKRLPSKYESSPALAVVKDRHSSRGGWREKGVTRDGSRISKSRGAKYMHLGFQNHGDKIYAVETKKQQAGYILNHGGKTALLKIT